MTLSFSKKFPNGTPTHFVEKIWTGFNLGTGGYMVDYDNRNEWLKKVAAKGHLDRNILGEVEPKIHTIREDKKNRWKVENNIHMAVCNRTKNRFQFAPTVPVINIEKFSIRTDGLNKIVTIGDREIDYLYDIDSVIYLDELSRNDGFKNIKSFFNYFPDEFDGKIIHWTHHKYS